MQKLIGLRDWYLARLEEKSTYIGIALLGVIYFMAPHISAIAPVLPDIIKVVGGFLIAAETKKPE
jgi:hypothetical protein